MPRTGVFTRLDLNKIQILIQLLNHDCFSIKNNSVEVGKKVVSIIKMIDMINKMFSSKKYATFYS